MVSHAKDWAAAYRTRHTPWELWGATPALEALVAQGHLGRFGLDSAARVAVPGCGRGHDVRLLAKQGLCVTGFDVAPEAVEEGRRLLALNRVDAEILRRDVLGLLPEFAGAFDLVYEYTCFCALPPHLRAAYARTVAGILAPGGYLFALMFPMAAGHAGRSGPPYLVTEQDVMDAFGPELELCDSFAPAAAWSPRQGAERWYVWRRRG